MRSKPLETLVSLKPDSFQHRHQASAVRKKRAMASLKRLSSPQVYTIGWITALDKELTAARAVLDEEHRKPENFKKHSKDTNSYVWGRISDHNVVVASLAAGKYGTVSAATTAWSMISSLPHLRFGLMVGIGAGIPRPADKVDIRLGDVVISQPSGTSSGVVQYDLGKLQGEGQFKRVGSLASPPEVLLKGLTALKAERRLSGPRTREILDDMVRRHPLLAEAEPDDAAFVHQGAQNDRLFRASSRHVQPPDQDSDVPPHGTTLQDKNQFLSALFWVWFHLWRSLLWLLSAPLAADGAYVARVNDQHDDADDADLKATQSKSCAYCDPHQEIKRRERSSSDPVVHYGVIASGDSVVKDAISRDDISRLLGNECICFEMEAAGLMDNFPCLVIRGICDYADTHKNDRWQNYAAATAAALAKELLGVIDSDDVEESSRMDEIMEQLQEDVSQIHSTTKDVQRSLHFQEVMKWLSAPDPSTNDNKAFKQRHENTGQWLVDSEKYSKWKKTPNSSLWLHGIPGCGKTILSSVIINNLRHTESCFTYLYFYFDFSDKSKQSHENAMRSLIAQLYYKCHDVQVHLDSLYSSCKNALRQPNIDQLNTVFTAMTEKAGEVWIVLDALDECQTRIGRGKEGLLPWIETVLSSRQVNTHLLVTSRPENDIKFSLERHMDDCITLQSDLVTKDIRAYVHARVTQSGGLERWRKQKEIQDDIEKHLLEKSNGMFRWVACQIDELEECLDPQALRETLESLPRTLDETYVRIINRIPPKLKRSAIRILQFLTYSERPLRLEEVCDAVAVAPQCTPRFNIQNRMPVPEEIAGYCSSLVIIVTRTDENGEDTIKELQLAHFSVKEYLISDRVEESLSAGFREPLARATITEVCLSYLLELDINLTRWEVKKLYPLASYAARYWTRHALLAETRNVHELIRAFCLQKSTYSMCYKLYDPDYPEQEDPPYHKSEEIPLLYYMAHAGLLYAVKELLRNGADINAQGGVQGNALQAASYKGHEEVVDFLLKEGADVNAQSGYYGNVLRAASAGGSKEIVQLLLKKGLQINAWDDRFGTALQVASLLGHEKVVDLLLREGADVNVQVGSLGSALQAASYGNHIKVVHLLLKEGAVIYSKGGFFGSAIQITSRNGYQEVRHLLVKERAEIVRQRGFHRSSLISTSAGGCKEIY